MVKKAVVLLSGGLDSSTILAVAKSQGFSCYCLSFAYGQRNDAELNSSKNIAKMMSASAHKVVNIDLRAFGGSALTDDIPVPKNREEDDIPITYVPARNTIFLSYALAWSEVLEAQAIYIGVNSIDFSGYPDCREEFIKSFQHLADVATVAGLSGNGVKIVAPLQNLNKAGIIKLGLSLGVDYSLTLSCYDPDAMGRACGGCDACLLRKNGFIEAGVQDPTKYYA